MVTRFLLQSWKFYFNKSNLFPVVKLGLQGKEKAVENTIVRIGHTDNSYDILQEEIIAIEAENKKISSKLKGNVEVENVWERRKLEEIDRPDPGTSTTKNDTEPLEFASFVRVQYKKRSLLS